MRFISPWWDENKAFDRVAKDTHVWREFRIPIRSISVLQHCKLDSVSIKISIIGGIIVDRRLTVFTPTSARQLLCGKATEDSL